MLVGLKQLDGVMTVRTRGMPGVELTSIDWRELRGVIIMMGYTNGGKTEGSSDRGKKNWDSTVSNMPKAKAAFGSRVGGQNKGMLREWVLLGSQELEKVGSGCHNAVGEGRLPVMESRGLTGIVVVHDVSREEVGYGWESTAAEQGGHSLAVVELGLQGDKVGFKLGGSLVQI